MASANSTATTPEELLTKYQDLRFPTVDKFYDLHALTAAAMH